MRRAKTERVTDLVNLDRVRGLLRTIYWRRRFLDSREETRRTLNAEAEGQARLRSPMSTSLTVSGIPAIVLEPIPATPPLFDGDNPFDQVYDRDLSPSPPSSHRTSPNNSPHARSVSLHSPEVGLGINAHLGHSPSLSVAGRPARSSLSRQHSNSSMLSSDDAHYRR